MVRHYQDGTYLFSLVTLANLRIKCLTDFICRGIGLWDFTMRPAQLLRKLEKNGVFRFTASIDVGGVPIHVEILTGIRFARITFAVGFAFDRESFGKVAEKLSGIGVDFLDKLGVELEVKGIYKYILFFTLRKFSLENSHPCTSRLGV